VVISGYYGFDNLGDELILQSIIQQLHHIEGHTFDITVLSYNPPKTAGQYNVLAIDRTSFVDIVDALSQAHLFISGGGGLFQDATGLASPFYYGGLILLARYFQIPVFFWSQGVGPLRSLPARWMTAFSLRWCEKVTVRDIASARWVERITGTMPEITADPVWQLDMAAYPQKEKDTRFYTVGLSLRPWKDLTDKRITGLAGFFKRWATLQDKPVRFLLFPFQEDTDFPVLQQFRDAMNAAGFNNVCHWVSQNVLIHSLSECDVFFGMRYHSLLLALLNHVPIYGLIYDPKVEQLVDQFKLGGTSISRLEYLDETVVNTYLKQYVLPDLTEMQTRSRASVDRFTDMVNRDVNSPRMMMD